MDAIGEMVAASGKAYTAYRQCTLKERKKAISAIRTELRGAVMTLAEMACRETGMGHSVDKARKIALAIDKTPGVEDLKTEAGGGQCCDSLRASEGFSMQPKGR